MRYTLGEGQQIRYTVTVEIAGAAPVQSALNPRNDK